MRCCPVRGKANCTSECIDYAWGLFSGIFPTEYLEPSVTERLRDKGTEYRRGSTHNSRLRETSLYLTVQSIPHLYQRGTTTKKVYMPSPFSHLLFTHCFLRGVIFILYFCTSQSTLTYNKTPTLEKFGTQFFPHDHNEPRCLAALDCNGYYDKYYSYSVKNVCSFTRLNSKKERGTDVILSPPKNLYFCTPVFWSEARVLQAR